MSHQENLYLYLFYLEYTKNDPINIVSYEDTFSLFYLVILSNLLLLHRASSSSDLKQNI